MLKKLLKLCLLITPVFSVITPVYANGTTTPTTETTTQSTTVSYYVSPVITIKDGDSTSTVQIDLGQKIREPSHIDKKGYRFLGWKDERTGQYWDFDSEINENITLVAVYEKLAIDDTASNKETTLKTNQSTNTGVHTNESDLILICVLAFIAVFVVVLCMKQSQRKEIKLDNDNTEKKDTEA